MLDPWRDADSFQVEATGSSARQARSADTQPGLDVLSIGAASASDAAQQPPAMTYSDLSRGIQRIFKETQAWMHIQDLEESFLHHFGQEIEHVAGIPTLEFLRRRKNVFCIDDTNCSAYLQPCVLAGPPIADPNTPKDEKFVLDEFEQLIAHLGPVCYISALCGKFIQRNGISVTSICGIRPLDVMKKYPEKFTVIGNGNVTLTRLKGQPEVVAALALYCGGRALSALSARRQEVHIPAKEIVTEEDVVEEFKRVIMQDGGQSVYISSLCGRFLQTHHRSVTAVVNSRPTDFLRKHPDVFEVVGGGNVRLRNPGKAALQEPHSLRTSSSRSNDAPEQMHESQASAASWSRDSGMQSGATANHGTNAPRSIDGGGRSVSKAVTRPKASRTCSDEGFNVPGWVSAHHPPGLEHAQQFDDQTCAAVLETIDLDLDTHFQLKERVERLCECIREHAFFDIQDIVVGGSLGKGLATRCTMDAELLILVAGLPTHRIELWLPHLLEALLAVLTHSLRAAVTGCRIVDGNSAELVLPEDKADRRPDASSLDLRVQMFIVQDFESREAALSRVRNCLPDQRLFLARAMWPQAFQLVATQPEHIKQAIKLLTWWSGQQVWSSPKTVPPSYLLELFVILAAEASPQAGVSKLVEVALDLCAHIPYQRFAWDRTNIATFAPDEVDPEVSHQRPYLVDPTNPCWNVVDPRMFDGSELAAYADWTHSSKRLNPFFAQSQLQPAEVYSPAQLGIPPLWRQDLETYQMLTL